MKLLRRLLAPLMALLLTFGSVAEVSAPVTVAAAGVVLGVGHAQAATVTQQAVVLGGVPSWVLRPSGTLPSIDMDFAHNRAWAGGVGVRAPPQFLTTVRASTGYAQWADGHLSVFAANIPRITDLGLLVEQAATNLALASQTLSSGLSWSFVNAAVTDNFTTAPDNTATGAKITATSGAGRCDAENAIALSNGATYYISVYAKQGTTKFLGFGFFDSSANQFQSFDLNAGTVQTTTGTEFSNAAITPAGNGWYRLTVKLITPASGALTGVKLNISDTANFNTPNATNGITGFFWGLQVETTGFTTSYIPTTTVAVTRAEDIISLAGVAATAATAAKAAFFQTNLVQTVIPNSARLITFNGGADIYYGSSTAFLVQRTGGQAASATIGGAGTVAGVVKSAGGFDASSLTAISKGGTKVTNAVAWDTNTGTITVGNQGGGNRALNGYIARMAFGATKGQYDGITAP